MKTRIQLFIHNLLGWGFPQRDKLNMVIRTGGDSFQSTYSCQFCSGDITRDSQGNWFHLTTGEVIKKEIKSQLRAFAEKVKRDIPTAWEIEDGDIEQFNKDIDFLLIEFEKGE